MRLKPPGDLFQLDTLDIRPLPGVVFKHFTAHGVLSSGMFWKSIAELLLLLLSPRSPKLNGYVEWAHRTHTKEFYEVTKSSFDIAELRGELLEWEQVYNAIRPHQALGYLTPVKFLEQWKENQGKAMMCH